MLTQMCSSFVFLAYLFLAYLFLAVSLQKEGDLQLISGTSSGSRLEIYINNAWSRVCFDGFDIYEGDIACRQLHFLYSERVGTTRSLGYGRGSGYQALSGLDCSTSDTKLIDCSTSLRSCSHYSEEVALKCTIKTSPVRLVSDSGRTLNLSSGRLEILINNQWGTVCSNFFSQTEADVACRQMGYNSANGFTEISKIGYEAVSKRIWLDHLDCSTLASNNNLRLCSLTGTGIARCSHDNDIFLSCTSPGFIRLTSSTSSINTNGQLEMYWNGEWGAVCNYPSISSNAAQVACKQLGFEKVIDYDSIKLLGSSTMFVLSGVVCSSSYKRTLLSCSHDGIGTPSTLCRSSARAVHLSCTASDTSSDTSRTTTHGVKSSYSGITIGGSTGGGIGGFMIFIIICAIRYYFYYKHRVSV